MLDLWHSHRLFGQIVGKRHFGCSAFMTREFALNASICLGLLAYYKVVYFRSIRKIFTAKMLE